jgi:hypothetical protein
LYESTYDTINCNKGDKNIATFIDDAVNYYIRFAKDQSELVKINEKLSLIKDTQNTILGLNCEVLRQAKILNGNGEIMFKPVQTEG